MTIDDGAAADPEPREVPDDDESALVLDGRHVDDDRHYLQNRDGLDDNALDADERHQDDLLELDQTELGELGLVLDDPHQPEPE